MSVLDHLRELRRRLILVVVIVALGSIVGWLVYNPVLDFLREPYCSVPAAHRYTGTDPNSCPLIFSGVLDGFTARLKVSLIAGVVFTAPLWLYQIWAFITPGLRKKERKYTLVFIAASSILFVAGMTLAYLVLAKGLTVLITTAGSGTEALLTVDAYLAFVTTMMLAFGAAFELPLLVVLANLAGALPARWLKRSQRIAIFLIFLFAGVATPSTDPFTMLALAIPITILYEGAVLFAIVHDRRKARRAAAREAEQHLDDEVPSAVDAIPQPLGSGDGWSDTT
jgi:sec-independent protein translocase protein TatC